MLSHHRKTEALNERRPPLAPPPAPAPKAAPAAPRPSYYDSMQVARQRRTEKLALDQHTTPTPTVREQRRQLKSREKSLLREIKPIENELAAVRQQLATLK